MLNNYPTSPEVRCTPGGTPNGMQFEITMPQVCVPAKCEQLLFKLGWTVRTSNPDTQEMLYYKCPPNDATDEIKKGWDFDLQNGYWHWYEAMAYEFGKFMSIGDDSHAGNDSHG